MRTKRLNEDAHLMLAVGDCNGALTILHEAQDMTTDCGEKTDAAYYTPRLYHRQAQIYSSMGRDKEARELLELSESEFDRGNVIGRAMVMRDYGWLQYSRWNERAAGIAMLDRALAMLGEADEATPTWEIERAVTQGMIARTKTPDVTRFQLLWVDSVMIQHKPDGLCRQVLYELDNLCHMLRIMPLAEQPPYMLRAIALRAWLRSWYGMYLFQEDFEEGRFFTALPRTLVRSARHVLPIPFH